MTTEKTEDEEIAYDEGHLLDLLQHQSSTAFREEFLSLHSYDQAQFYKKVGPDIRKQLYVILSPKEMADLYEGLEVDDDEYEAFLREMDTAYGAEMLSHMYTDDAVDVLNELDDKHRESYLEMMDDDVVDEINELLGYAEDTAGSIMTTEYVAIPEASTVETAMTILRKEAPNAETIYYIFVVDEAHRLTGVVSLRDLIIADPKARIHDIMNERVVMVHVKDDQEEVAQIMKDYNFLATPVINDAGVLLGIITVDDIIDVIDEEASEDYSKLAGISDMDKFDINPFQSAAKRLPWLVILLFLGMLTANLMGQFEATLEKVALLAIFIPLIAGTSGNSGTQALAVAIRGIATGDLEDESKLKLLVRELFTGMIMGVVCGLLIIGIVYFWKGELLLGMLVGAAICCSIIVATLAGSFIPLLMHRLKIDPAVASGPFITTLNDITSILIYLGLATVFLSQIG